MMINGLLVPIEALEIAELDGKNLSIIVEKGVIKIVEDDEEFCFGFFVVDNECSDEEERSAEIEILQKQVLGSKGNVYMPSELRKALSFEVGSVLGLSIVDEGLLVVKIM